MQGDGLEPESRGSNLARIVRFCFGAQVKYVSNVVIWMTCKKNAQSVRSVML